MIKFSPSILLITIPVFISFNIENVFPNTKYISLFIDKAYCTKNKNCKKRVIDRFHLDYIIKHPREKYQKFEGVEKLENNKISEELIYELTISYKVKVIGIYSISLLNIVKYQNIEVVNVKVNLKKPIKKLENILNNAGVRNVNV